MIALKDFEAILEHASENHKLGNYYPRDNAEVLERYKCDLNGLHLELVMLFITLETTEAEEHCCSEAYKGIARVSWLTIEAIGCDEDSFGYDGESAPSRYGDEESLDHPESEYIEMMEQYVNYIEEEAELY